MKVAALDLGSNTTLLLIAEVENNKVSKVYRDEISVTRMGQGVNASREFHPEALARMDQCLLAYSAIIKKEKPDRVLAMATSAARDVKNAEELFRLGAKHGIEIQVIPGEMEAAVTFEGATYEYENDEGIAVIDVGGGSTEVIAKVDSRLTGTSLNVGSVRLTEMMVTKYPTPKSEVQKIFEYVEAKFDAAAALLPPKGDFRKSRVREVIAVAGTPTTLAMVLQQKGFSEEAVHGYSISVATLEEWVYKFAALDIPGRMALTGMDPKRADVIVAGCAVLLVALRVLGSQHMTVSTRGVRYGVALLAARGSGMIGT